LTLAIQHLKPDTRKVETGTMEYWNDGGMETDLPKPTNHYSNIPFFHQSGIATFLDHRLLIH